MNDLRLVILLIGLIIIVGIYLWETIKQRDLQRKQTVRHLPADSDISNIRISTAPDEDDNYSSAISDLNVFLAESKKQEDENVAEKLSLQLSEDSGDRETEDLFDSSADTHAEISDQEVDAGQNEIIEKDQIVILHITASGDNAFGGNEIIEAANTVGLEYGQMNIFHHFGIGQMKMDKPLFSLADMFEPGNFELQNMARHRTRGLALFLCFPVEIDGLLVFELMLNTAQRLADILGGEVRGSNHELIDDSQMAAIRDTISLNSLR